MGGHAGGKAQGAAASGARDAETGTAPEGRAEDHSGVKKGEHTMNIDKALENAGFSPEEKKRASEIFRQLDGLKISEAEMILTFCGKVLDQCVITVDWSQS